MVATGFLLWFDNFFVQHLPKLVMDLAGVVHFWEAWLAALAILVWHMYAVVFNPEVYPMNPSWLTGKMPEWMHRREHPSCEVDDDGRPQDEPDTPPSPEEAETDETAPPPAEPDESADDSSQEATGSDVGPSDAGDDGRDERPT
jgi:hypothetical protein